MPNTRASQGSWNTGSPASTSTFQAVQPAHVVETIHREVVPGALLPQSGWMMQVAHPDHWRQGLAMRGPLVHAKTPFVGPLYLRMT